MPVPGLDLGPEDVPVAMGVCSLPEQTLVLMNDTALELVGWPRSEALGRRAGDLLTGSAQTPDGDAGLAALASGELTPDRPPAKKWAFSADPAAIFGSGAIRHSNKQAEIHACPIA